MIPLYKPWLTDLEKEYLHDAYASGWISSQGSYIERFEKAFADYIGVKHAVAINNGTAACHLACLACGIGNDDDVVVPDITFIASANAVRYCNANVILADVDKDTWNISLRNERRRGIQFNATMPVHLYGNPCDMDEVFNFAKRHGQQFVIEDACESLGATYKGRKTGSLSHVAAFSFFGNKTITTGEGGMITTDSDSIAEAVRLYRGQGQTKRYFHEVVGYNYRMTNLQAAIGLAQITRIDEIMTEKARIYDRYMENLGGHSWIHTQKVLPDATHSKWLFAMTLDDNARDEIAVELKNAGVDTRPIFYPIHEMPPYSTDESKFPNSVHLARNGICLPSYPELTNDEVDYICKVIENG